MAKIGLIKIQRELKEVITCKEAAECGIKLKLIDDKLDELMGEIVGPPGTPYEKGKFALDIKIPKDYPFKPPDVKFLNKVWHPNISPETGYICVDILKQKWSPAITIRSILFSIQSLLSTPVPDDPENVEASKQFKEHPGKFKITASRWTNLYAGKSNRIYFEKQN